MFIYKEIYLICLFTKKYIYLQRNIFNCKGIFMHKFFNK